MRVRALLLGAAGWAAMGGGAADAEETAVDELVVVGSRGAPRLATETAAPVDVLRGEDLAARGFNDLTKVLEFLAPSFNYPRSSSGPSMAGARPATLRGLSPDQVLVLVNGVRRHASSIITFNNGPYRGSVPVDYNTIPITAIERVEILRDGAGAQYGSDAIAGVINIVLRGEDSGTFASAQYGETERGQGQTTILAARQGFRLGEGGHLTIAAEMRDRNDTNGAEIDPRFGRVTSTLGDPQATDLDLTLNAAMPVGAVTLRGFVTFADRNTEMSPLYRAPNVFPAFYPNGFLPIVNLDLTDVGASLGASGNAAGWTWDLSDTFGYSKADYRVSNTVNTSLGTASPRAFEGGGARYAQNLVNLTVHRAFDVAAGANLAAGVEHRHERYELVPGEPLSYALAGAQGFPGFNPPFPVDVDRNAVSAYLDGEFSPRDGLNLGLAGRYEDYSDFGDAWTGKATVFWRATPLVAFRASAGAGIRAPSLQQQYFSTVTSQINNGVLQNVGTFAVSDPIAVALGSSPLKPEKSTSYAAGLVVTPGHGLTFSVDVFQIDIDDRIALSENLQGPQVTAILRANGVTNAAVARFFTNAADTRSKGWEATLRWDVRLPADARLGLTAAYGAFDTDVRALASNQVLPASPLLGAMSIDLMTDGQPRNKAVLNADLSWDEWRFTGDVTKFGAHRSTSPLGGPNQVMKGGWAVDFTAAYTFRDRFTLTAGVLNLLDEYPDRLIGDNTGRPYSEVDPLGFNGREYFVRLAAEF